MTTLLGLSAAILSPATPANAFLGIGEDRSEPTLEAANEDKKLLIVEDNVVNMKVAISILKRLGFQDIDTANDGLEALERIKDAGGPQAYHVILMDLHMPNLDGVGAVREIDPHVRLNLLPISSGTSRCCRLRVGRIARIRAAGCDTRGHGKA